MAASALDAQSSFPAILAPFKTAWLAEQIGVARQTIDLWRRGLSVPSAERVLTIADVTGAPVEVILRAIEAQRSAKVAS